MSTFCLCIFWIAVIGLASPHLFYPPLLFLLSRFHPAKLPGKARPTVSLIVSAFNEGGVIRDKILNALRLEYPRDLLEVMVISDASTDATDSITSEYSRQGVRLCRQNERLGKSAGLTRFCPEATGDVLVFTDANAMFHEDAIAKLVRHFDDPKVGFVVGRQLYENSNSASADSENLYWSLELRLKEWESRLSSVVGADGAIYALRKNLFEPLEPDDINDFVLPLKVVVKGFRGVFDPEAVCVEEAAPDFQGEFRRKYRIVNRSLRAVTKVPSALNPLKVGWFAFQLLVHKVLRWMSPVFLCLLLGSSIVLARQEFSDSNQPGFYGLFLGLQLLGYMMAAAYLIPAFRKIKLIYVAYYFLLINLAAAVGFGLLLSGRTIRTWKPQR